MVTGQDIVTAARQLAGAYYRWWYVGASLPMFGETAPSWDYIVSDPGVGVMCADLLDWARMECGLSPLRGTSGYASSLVDVSAFDPNMPGVAGAVALAPYSDPYSQGHVALYTGEHQLIQSLVNPGVTEDYTDAETATWPGCEFQYYGLMPDVAYDTVSEPAQPEPTNWFGIGSDNVVRLGGDYSNGWLGTDRDGWLRRVE